MISDGLNDNGTVLIRRNRGTRMYVWIVSGSTILLVATLLWPISVTRFQSTARFQLSYNPSAGLEKRDLNQMVVDAVRGQTEKHQLDRIIAGLNLELKNPIKSFDPETVRDLLRIQNRPGQSANSLDFQISILGNGTAGEVAFINALVSRVTSNIGNQSSSQSAVDAIDSITRDMANHQQQLIQDCSQDVDVITGRITSAQNELQIVVNNMKNIGSLTDLGDSTTTNASSAELIRRRDQLLKQKRQTMAADGVNEFHPSITPIQSQIEQLHQQILSGQNDQLVADPGTQEANRVTNQFVSSEKVYRADAQSMSTALDEAIAEIQMIDLFNPRQRLVDLQEKMERLERSPSTFAQRLGDRAKSQLAAPSPLSFNQLIFAENSQPIGGVPSMKMFLLISLCAGLIASLVAINFDPNLRKRPFQSTTQIENKLRVPVVGLLRSRNARTEPRTWSGRLAIWFVQACEWMLLAVLIVLIVAALINSELVGAFLENPFHAATKVFWMIASK